MGDVKERLNESESEQVDELIRKSYSEFVRLERRNLLIVSSTILVSALAGLVPNEASILGLSFKKLTPGVFYGILVVLTIYFLAAFSIYSFPTYKEAKERRRKILKESSTLEYHKPWYSMMPPNMLSDSRYYFWMFLHFFLPIITGIASCIVGFIKMTLIVC